MQIDVDGSGFIEQDELGQALELCGQKVPAYEIRQLMKDCDFDCDGKISMNEFKAVSVLGYIISVQLAAVSET